MSNNTVESPLPVSLRRRTQTLGHGLLKLNEAWRLLGIRLERGLLDEETTAWVKRWGGSFSAPLPLPVDSGLQALIVWAGRTWQVDSLVGEDAGAVAPWFAVLMLLHLPALRGFWRRALRTQRFTWMTRALPQVWAVDHQTVRPGSVIAGLNITHWGELPRLIASGRRFETIPVSGGQAQPVDAESWPGILANKERPVFLHELSMAEPEGSLRAAWKRNETGRIVLDSLAHEQPQELAA